jgi:uncharacterized protein (TIGR02266 family)
MEKKYYAMLVLFDDVSKSIDDFLSFLKVTISRFYPDDADEISVFVSGKRHTVYVLLKFEFAKFLPSYFVWLNNWASRLNLKIIDFMKMEKARREEILKEIKENSENKFTTPFDIDPAQRVIRNVWTGGEDKRENERVRAEIKVHFKTPRDFLKKYTDDISKGGIFVKAINPLPMNTKVKVVLMPPGQDNIELTGKVVYVLNEEQATKIGRSPGMGVEFFEVSPDTSRKLEEIIEKIKEKITLDFEEKRRDERVIAEIKLKFKTTNGFIQKYTEDISKGGVFIKTDKPLPFDTRVKVLIELPDLDQIELNGRVVYVLNEEEAKKVMREPGMGIQFIDVSPEISKKLEDLLEEIKVKKLNGEKKK